jgi:hypothetical protein
MDAAVFPRIWLSSIRRKGRGVIDLYYRVDDQAIKNVIQEAGDLESNDELFSHLAQIARIKRDFKDVEEVLDKLELEIKTEINDRAKALYGPQWQAIKGDGYKITHSYTGSIYEVTGEPAPELVEVKQSIKSKLVDEYVKSKGTLPEGIGYNPNRGEAIRITVKDDE